MPTNLTYQCEAWLVEDDQEHMDDDSSSPEGAMFLISMFSDFTPFNSTQEEGTASRTILKKFQVKREHLIHSWSTIVTMLTDMNIPLHVHPIMIQKIVRCAQESQHLDRKVIPMVVRLTTIQSSNGGYDDDAAAAFLESFHSQGLRFIGASKLAIEKLEKVKVDKDFSRQCVICLEDISIGMEVTRMPCLHVYHESCIQNWLQNSNVCPLCRFQVPWMLN